MSPGVVTRYLQGLRNRERETRATLVESAEGKETDGRRKKKRETSEVKRGIELVNLRLGFRHSSFCLP